MNTTVEEKLKPFVDSVKLSLQTENYYAALSVAFILPDICSKLEFPDKYTGSRYILWFEKYLKEFYQHEVGADHEIHVFLSAKDFYALRCVFLHQGQSDISEQDKQETINNFIFTKPDKINNNNMHRNYNSIIIGNRQTNKLQLQVDTFCEEILSGTAEWLNENKNDSNINNRSLKLMHIFNNYI